MHGQWSSRGSRSSWLRAWRSRSAGHPRDHLLHPRHADRRGDGPPAERLPRRVGRHGTVVVQTEDGAPFTDAQQEAVVGLVAEASDVDGVSSVIDPFQTEADRAAQQQEVEAGRTQVEEGRAQLEAGQAQLDAARAQAEAAGRSRRSRESSTRSRRPSTRGSQRSRSRRRSSSRARPCSRWRPRSGPCRRTAVRRS
ncbi:hypothetical protein NKG05_09955 [Oerskovia sp. M15]